MISTWRKPLLPAFVGACLLLGGSTTGVWTNLALQLAAIALIAVSLATPSGERAPRRARQLIGIALATVGLVAVQLVPLPPAVWTALPGRDFVIADLALLGLPPPWLPLSLAPLETLMSAAFLLPPLAILLWIVRGGALSLRATVAVLLLIGLAGAVLGLRQIGSGDMDLFFYRFSSWGKAPGFFANSTHMAVLMLASVPFLAALIIDVGDRLRDRGRSAGLEIGGIALFVIFMALIVINSSGAVLLLSAPVLFLTIALWGGRGVARLRRFSIPLVAAALAGAITLTFLSGRTQTANDTSIGTRSLIWSHSAKAVAEFAPAGSGIGSFAKVYQRFEDAAEVDLTYVNHAHNDYLELALETGLPGVVLIALFLWWWARAAWSVWRGAHENVYARAATIVSGALLIHELVEYPLRSPALAALFALSVGLMALHGVLPGKRQEGDLWATRHLSID